jgi:NADH-quinone oxidoreductase subunit M
MEFILGPIMAAFIARLMGNKLSVYFAGLLSLTGIVIQLINYPITPLINSTEGWKTIQDYQWLDSTIHFTFGMDGLTWILLLLTNGLMPFIVFSMNSNHSNRLQITMLALLMQAGLNGVFLSKDGLSFYIFWELALIPIYFITLLYSEAGKDNFKHTIRFFIYTFFGSLGMLFSLIYLNSLTESGSFAYEELLKLNLTYNQSIWVSLGFLLAFAVKIPLFPFHGWQANTYTFAPAAGTMLLSGIMLKMGLYGVLRWFLPMCGETLYVFQPYLISLSVIGIVYGGIIAIRQNDMKRLVAYSSLSHVGLIAAGFFTLTNTGFSGGVLQMLVHGINVVGLFYSIEIIQQLSGRNLNNLGGLAKKYPVFAVVFFLFVIGTAAAPLSNGFPGEFLLLKSVFSYNSISGIFAGFTIILCAVYMLRMYQFSMLGADKGQAEQKIELNQWFPLAVLSIFVIVLGIFPQYFIDIVKPSLDQILLEISNAKGVLS